MIVFVAVNPLLYVRPVDRVVRLIQHRQDEMQFQRSVFSDQTVPDELSARVNRVIRRTFGSYATPRGPLPVSPDLLLVPIGLAVLVRRGLVDLRQGAAGTPLLFLCWLGATYAVVTPNLGFDSSHYFAPLVTLNVVASGVAVAATVSTFACLVRWLRRRLGPDPAQNVQAPIT